MAIDRVSFAARSPIGIEMAQNPIKQIKEVMIAFITISGIETHCK